MVDFQSRDTRRGPSDDEADDESDDEADGDVTDAETEPPAEPGDEPERSEPEPNAADRDETGEPASDGRSPSDRTEPTGTENRESGRRTDETHASGERDPPAADPSQSESAATTDRAAETTQSSPRGAAESATGVSETGPAATEPEPDGQVDGASTRTERSTGPAQTPATDETQADTAAAADRDAASAADDSPIPVDVAVVTIATTDEHGGDPVGESLVATLEADGHTVTTVERLRGDYDGVQQAVDTLVERDDVETVVTAGGLGLDPADATIEAVHPLFEKALPGFGEAYRSLLSEHIGTGIVAVRATAGLADGVPVFCLPGDEQAARFGVEEIVTTEAGRLVAELR